MKQARIFLVGDQDTSLIPMVEAPYDTEAVLQVLLARYPDLLPGDQINPENPRRWLLVGRELGVPGAESETGRWSLDHLFLDQDGIPTFVECKRASDTRVRREVVAQMLDYAANGTEYWTMERLRQAAAETYKDRSANLDEMIMELIQANEEAEVEDFWRRVEENLRLGKIRLIFVGDYLPKELRRLIEFLNEKMSDVEVLGIEIKQYLGKGQRAMVPRTIGISELSKPRPPSPKPRIDRDKFLEACTPESWQFFQKIWDRAEERGHSIYWGTKGFSIRAIFPKRNFLASIVYGYPPAIFEIYLAHLQQYGIPEQELADIRRHLLEMDPLKEGGEKTIRMNLDRTNVDIAEEAYDFILAKVSDLAENY